MISAAPPFSSDPHVTILMCTRNGARWIDEQFESYLNQTHRNWSLWISDDGSVDETRDRIEDFSARHPGLVDRVVEGPRHGPAANFLHLLCHPDLPDGIVALSDQDDVWLPQKLEQAVARLRLAGDRPCAWSARYFISDERLVRRRESSLWRHGPSLGNAVVQNILSGHTMTLNAAALSLVRQAGMQNIPHHDWWIYLVLMATGAQAIVDPQIVLHYRQHEANVMGVRSTARGRLTRLEGLRQGQLGGWVAANMAALLTVSGLPLADRAKALLEAWSQTGPAARLRLLREFGVHRQSGTETALIYLAAGLGRL